MINIEEVIIKISDAGVSLYLEDGLLKSKSLKQSMDAETINLIRGNKEALIEYLSSKQVDSSTQITNRPKITPFTGNEGAIPLSYAQERLWFIEQLEGANPSYNIPFVYPLGNDFKIDVAEKAFAQIVRRHESLRTIFKDTNGVPEQVIRESFKFSITTYDLTHLAKNDKKQQCQQLIQKERNTVFDLTRDLMLRASYVNLSDSEAQHKGVLLLTLHHIAADGWSINILSKEFSFFYEAILAGREAALTPLEIQYADYAQWQRQWLSGDVLESQLTYWDQQLEGAPTVHSLPLDFSRPKAKEHTGAGMSEALSRDFSQQLMQVARKYVITPFMLCHSLFALLLSRHGNSKDIVIGTPVANRLQVELEPLIGFFINTLVLRVNTDVTRLDDFIRHVKQVNLEAQSHQDVPFETLVERCQVPRSTQHTPLIQIMLNMNNNERGQRAERPQAKTGIIHYADEIAKFDLSLDVDLSEAGGEVSWVYDTSILSQQHVETLHRHFINLLKAIVQADDDSTIAELILPSAEETLFLRETLNDTKENFSDDLCLHELLEVQANKTPNKKALVFNDLNIVPQYLSYKRLNENANCFAHYLIDKHQVQPEKRIGICLERSLEMVVSIFAVLKSGGAYVPLDPSYPKERLDYLVSNAEITTIITNTKQLKQHQFASANCIDIGDPSIIKEIVGYPAKNISKREIGLSQSNLAYVIYTSGSTGLPKGVMVEHQSVANLGFCLRKLMPENNDKEWGWFASFAFDSSVKGLTQLAFGQTLNILANQLKLEPQVLKYQLGSLSIIDCTPSMVETWFATNIDKHLPDLIIGGEKISEELWKKLIVWQEKYGRKAINAYGPTENTVNTSLTTVSDEQPNIGSFLSNVRGYVTNESAHCGYYCIGELQVCGTALARGYINQPALTAEKFVPNQFYSLSDSSNESRLYKTGDLVNIMPNGDINFIGREDSQVKIQGFRIELGEIDHALSKLPEIESAKAIVHHNESQTPAIVAYVLAANTNHLNDEDLVKKSEFFLHQNLPSFMQPAMIIPIKKWPLTVNGKLDEKALPLPSEQLLGCEFKSPSTEVEHTIVEILAKLLNVSAESINLNADFFKLGGHSLLAVRLMAEIREHLACEIPIKSIFERPQIISFCLLVESIIRQSKVTEELSGENSSQVEEIEW